MPVALVKLWCGARIERAITAYVVCCFLATAMVAMLSLPVVAFNLTRLGHWGQFEPIHFVLGGIGVWFAISVAGMIAALPFVPAATWLGIQLRIETGFYYFASGGLAPAILLYPLIGPPRQTDFGGEIFAWTVAPACGAAWGALWWILHRRWAVASKIEETRQ